ncbi:MAG: VOC family protein [Solirubrobacterales bacterium]
MARATGIGGVFFRAEDPTGLAAWYGDALGLEISAEGFSVLPWDSDPRPDGGATVWAPFASDTDYLAPAKQWMVNFRVDELEGTLERLRRSGATVDEEIEESELGRFGWAFDPEGNRIELWEPPESKG